MFLPLVTLNPTSLVTRVQCWFLFDLQSKFLWFCAIEEVHFSAWIVGISVPTLFGLRNESLFEIHIESNQLSLLLLNTTRLNFLPLRPKFLKSLQNEGIFPLITINVLIYASNLIN